MRLQAREFTKQLMENQILPDKSWMGKDLLETLNNLKKRKRFRDPVAHIIKNMEKVMKSQLIPIAERSQETDS